jgi:hypothetical protein
MRVLLDTNVLIHREARTVVREDIGRLFQWLDQLGYDKCVHPDSVDEVKKHADPAVVRTLGIKLGSYKVLKTRAPDTPAITALRARDTTPNDAVDTSLLSELFARRVDALISEDRGVHRKAKALGVEFAVFTIDSFLEKAAAENPVLADYKVLAVHKRYFGDIDLGDIFFDSFRADYPGFDVWFNGKADEEAYVSFDTSGTIAALLYIKREGPGEDYRDIHPEFAPAHRLKIGTFKVVSNGYTLGERFLKIVFDNALLFRVEEIYVTLYRSTADHDRLADLLIEWGFVEHGWKDSPGGREIVFVRDFRPAVDAENPKLTFPYVSGGARKFIVPIYPKYHTELLPDSILRTEDPDDFAASRRHRNALEKVYVSRSIERGLVAGDVIVFYRTKTDGAAHYTSVTTSIGVVQGTADGFVNADNFIAACRRRSVFSDEELLEHWNWDSRYRPFVVYFLFVHSFPNRINLMRLKDLDIITEAPRGFDQITDEAFAKLITVSDSDDCFIVDKT